MPLATPGFREAASEPAASGAATIERPVRESRARRQPARQTSRHASDDEILGIHSAPADQGDSSQLAFDRDRLGDAPPKVEDADVQDGAAIPASSADLQATLDAHPDLRRAWQDAQSYREAFATPEEARTATALLGDLERMDALFFSGRPEDHAELARAVANLNPSAFASLAQAMSNLAAQPQPVQSANRQQTLQQAPNPHSESAAGLANSQAEFLHTANAAAVRGVVDAIEPQVERLLPDGVSKSARNRVVGEIYRELEASLSSNRQLAQQMRDALRSGALDSDHQRAIVSLVTGRARQALPGIAKRVLNEWTSTVIAANQGRLARQQAAAHRVDIAGSGRGGDGSRRSLGPRDLDYARMSDSDILNL
jgi:hypothetical protein